MSRLTRIALAVIVAALAASTIAPSFGFFSDSGSWRYTVTAAGVSGDGQQDETSDEVTDEAADGKVWVCKVVGSPGNYFLAPGENPIHVSVHSVDAQEGFSDAHPSYVVQPGEECTWPRQDPDPTRRAAAEPEPDDRSAGSTMTTTDPAETQPPDSEPEATETPEETATTTTTTSTVPADEAPDPAGTTTTTLVEEEAPADSGGGEPVSDETP